MGNHKVVIAEKPSVAKDIAQVLGAKEKKEGYLEGNGYVVTWAFGHLVELDEPAAYGWTRWDMENLPMLPDPFKLTLKDDAGAKKQFKTIKELFKDASEIIVATDAGREGELIFRYIYQVTGSGIPFKRLWISSLTNEAIKEGLSKLKPGTEYDNLFYAARSRSEADWLVGLNATQCLTLVSGSQKPLSLGRVQTPVLAMICNRFLENKHFKSLPFFEVEVNLNKGEKGFTVWHTKRFDTKADAESVRAKLVGELECTHAETKPKKETQPLLFDLTSLQATANKKQGFSAQKTLDLMQSLYETHKVLTYPRTSSQYLSEDVFRTLPSVFDSLQGDYLSLANELVDKSNLPKKSVDDKKVTDHHAIIPTGKKADNLSPDEQKIFDLVVRRFIAAFSPICEKEVTNYKFEDKGERYEVSGTVIKSLGWRKAEIEEKKEEDELKDDEKPDQTLPKVEIGEKLKINSSKVLEKKTKPKPILNESSLLKMMETAGKEIEDEELSKAIKDCGIGTPATRASIIETLIKRTYVVRDKKKLVPSELGLSVYDLVKEDVIASPEMTGQWEFKINKMAEGEYSPSEFMEEIKRFTSDYVQQLKGKGATVQVKKHKCPKCKVGELKDGFKALNCERKEQGCDFLLWKEVSGKQLTEAQLEKLFTTGSSGLIKGFMKKDKSGKFDANLVFDEDYKLRFSFDKTSEKGEDKKGLKCPLCKEGDIKESDKNYYCSRYKDGCKFGVWKEISGKKISASSVTELVEKGRTGLIKGFKKKDSTDTFDAHLKLVDEKVSFDFPKK